jgi:hypothetical protein
MRNIKVACERNDISISKYIETTPAPQYTWERPPSWLNLPDIVDTDEVFYALYPVTNTDYNTATITAQGNYIVDWGDGSIENFASGATATHNYSFASIPSSTITPFGYRQAIIKVIPQAGASFTQIGNITGSSFLDIAASGPNLVIQNIDNNLVLSALRLLCKITGQITLNGSLRYIDLDYNAFSLRTSLANVFASNRALQYVSPFNTFAFTAFNGMFSSCASLISFPDINLSNAINIASICSGCSSMVYFPPTNFTGPAVLPNGAAFNGCNSLRSLTLTGFFDIQSSTTFAANSLLEFPEINLSNQSINYSFASSIRRIKAFGGKTSVTFANNSAMGRAQIVEFFQNLGTANSGASIDIANCFGTPSLSAGDRLIATNKGYTLIG